MPREAQQFWGLSDCRPCPGKGEGSKGMSSLNLRLRLCALKGFQTHSEGNAHDRFLPWRWSGGWDYTFLIGNVCTANFRGKEWLSSVTVLSRCRKHTLAVWISLEDTKAHSLKAELTEAQDESGKISRTPTVLYSCTETGSLSSEGA